MFDTVPNPVAFTIFGLTVRWYAICICAGMILSAGIALHRAPKRGIQQEDLMDGILWTVPLGVVGARLWYVWFNRAYYDSFFDVINLRAGGLAIHGGLLFGMITACLVCRRKHMPVLKVLDLTLPCVALAQAIGRWGNYFNSEAHGTPTRLPWGILVDGVHVHPTFLYESLWCLFLFFFLSWKECRPHFEGKILCLYAILYSLERLLVEQLRTDSLLLGPKDMVTALIGSGYDPSQVSGALHLGSILIFPCKTAQLTSLLAMIAGAIGYVFLKKRAGRVETVGKDV